MAEPVDPSVLRELIDCDFDTGVLIWRERDPIWFPDSACARKWNGKWAGKPALNCVHSNGYRYGSIFKKRYFAHRVIWAHFHGLWPDEDIDHQDGNRSHNAIKNLRSVSRKLNCRNKRLRDNNKSGVNGVYWSKQSKKWAAQIRVDGGRVHLGVFDDLRDAARVRKQAERENGYHENHGRAA